MTFYVALEKESDWVKEDGYGLCCYRYLMSNVIYVHSLFF